MSAADLSRYSATDFGDGITREHCVAMMGDPNATELARQTFIKNATGQVVRWLLYLSNVREADKSESLVADFEMPYSIAVQIESQSGIATSDFSVRAVFPATERERLLALRRGDWVTVEGRLQLEPSVMLIDARIALPTDVEKPAR